MLDKYRDHAPADQPIIVTSRIIAATAERIFAAYSDAETIGLWWGPDGFSTTTIRRDFRVGGEWLYTMHGPDGTDYPNYSVFKEIEPYRRIVYDHGTAPDQPFMFTGAIQFEPVSGGTKVTILLTFAGTALRDEVVMKYGAVEGGIQHLARLDGYVTAHP